MAQQNRAPTHRSLILINPLINRGGCQIESSSRYKWLESLTNTLTDFSVTAFDFAPQSAECADLGPIGSDPAPVKGGRRVGQRGKAVTAGMLIAKPVDSVCPATWK